MKKLCLIFAIFTFVSCSKKLFDEKWTNQKAPSEFRAVFETTSGNFEIYANRNWSPRGVDRLYALIKNGFYTDIAIFRVIPNFVAQFGIHNDSILNTKWSKFGLIDEPVIQKNDSMTIAFARSGKNSRTTQIFINLKDNHRLDDIEYNGAKGFPVIAKVTKGSENIMKFYDLNNKNLEINQDSIQKFGNRFIKEKYPKVAFIKKATILKIIK